MIPKYEAIAADIRRSIEDGTLKPGDKLPTVVEFCELYSAFGKNGDPALGLDDLSTQVIVMAVHISDFFMKLLHRLDAVCL